MPTRFWGDAQRARYGRFPDLVDDEDIARCFHLDERDQAIVAELRGSHNRLGFALHLGAARLVGAFPSESDTVPIGVLGALADQLGEHPAPASAHGSGGGDGPGWRRPLTTSRPLGSSYCLALPMDRP